MSLRALHTALDSEDGYLSPPISSDPHADIIHSLGSAITQACSGAHVETPSHILHQVHPLLCRLIALQSY